MNFDDLLYSYTYPWLIVSAAAFVAAVAPKAWDLRCRVREALIDFFSANIPKRSRAHAPRSTAQTNIRRHKRRR